MWLLSLSTVLNVEWDFYSLVAWNLDVLVLWDVRSLFTCNPRLCYLPSFIEFQLYIHRLVWCQKFKRILIKMSGVQSLPCTFSLPQLPQTLRNVLPQIINSIILCLPSSFLGICPETSLRQKARAFVEPPLFLFS